MYLLASTADEYLSPALEHLTLAWGLSDSLAGVTLLAFGNGAPDVFSAIAAASSGAASDPDATKSISILLGGTFFVTCIVVSASTSVSNLNEDPNGPKDRRIKVTPRFFLRDVIFFIVTCAYLLYVQLLVGKFSIYHSIALLLNYTLYVITVVYQSKTGNKDEKLENDKVNLFNELVS